MEAVSVTCCTGQLPLLFVGRGMLSQLGQGLGLEQVMLLPTYQH